MVYKVTESTPDKRSNCPKRDFGIGIFDSGLGGLTVTHDVTQALPHENIHYLGDTARVPYGEKSDQTIIRYSKENTAFLLSKEIKLLVVACNTASAYAMEALRREFAIPIVDVIEPTVRRAVHVTKNRRIAVLGTRATIRSGVYEKKIQHFLPEAKVTSIPCPLFVPLVEEDFLSHAATQMIVQEYLRPVKECQCDTIILGCTHYPLLVGIIRQELREGITILDSASSCASMVQKHLHTNMLMRGPSHQGKRNYYVTDDPERFRHLGESFLRIPLEDVQHVHIQSRSVIQE